LKLLALARIDRLMPVATGSKRLVAVIELRRNVKQFLQNAFFVYAGTKGGLGG